MKRVAVRIGLTVIDVALCVLAVVSGVFGYPIIGLFVAFAAVMLAWIEGREGWGSAHTRIP